MPSTIKYPAFWLSLSFNPETYLFQWDKINYSLIFAKDCINKKLNLSLKKIDIGFYLQTVDGKYIKLSRNSTETNHPNANSQEVRELFNLAIDLVNQSISDMQTKSNRVLVKANDATNLDTLVDLPPLLVEAMRKSLLETVSKNNLKSRKTKRDDSQENNNPDNVATKSSKKTKT